MLVKKKKVSLGSKIYDRFNKDAMGNTVLVMSTFCADGISDPQISSWPGLGVGALFPTVAEKGHSYGKQNQ